METQQETYDDWALNEAQKNEWAEWKNIWLVLEELNDSKWRALAVAIERWAYCDRIRREALKEAGKDYGEDGIFWRLEED